MRSFPRFCAPICAPRENGLGAQQGHRFRPMATCGRLRSDIAGNPYTARAFAFLVWAAIGHLESCFFLLLCGLQGSMSCAPNIQSPDLTRLLLISPGSTRDLAASWRQTVARGGIASYPRTRVRSRYRTPLPILGAFS